MSKRTKSNLVGIGTVSLLSMCFALSFAALATNSLLLALISFTTAIVRSEMKEWYGKCRMEEIDELFDDINSSDLYL
ncbi:hypothetical protein SAMN05443270_3149 [Lacrimispora sphenoides]|uniref:hypothetical protein n=1 Tax=Lacrimispora sphenoides TaxID=29370 RepID=UPI0008CE4BC2|nr:hypothetical protein [Lacrimispora sphenoides]SEU10048.1 hypothetical protein SAMN05443270_3149 [Lacrimispora sphenoides]